MADINRTCRDVEDAFREQAAQAPYAAKLLTMACGRVTEILRGYYAALAANDTDTVIGKYFDLMPADIQAKIHNGAMKVLSDCGVDVEKFKDDTGTTYLRLNGVEKLGIPDDEVARINSLADDLPLPVGKLHRVQ